MFSRPSIGSWVSYGLGTVNQNLPAFIVLAPYLPYGGGQVWGSDFLPAAHQGTRIVPGGEPIPNMTIHNEPAALQAMELRTLAEFNRKHLASRASDPSLAARIKSFETAFGMQREAPEVFDLTKETDATHKLYGLERGSTQGFAWQCLVARRLAERGVRFIELIDSGSDLNRNWDAHFDIQTHVKLARNVDQRVRTNVIQSEGRWERPGASQSSLLVVAGGGRRKGRDGLRRERRIRNRSGERRNALPRFPRHYPAPAGHGSHAANLPLRRA
jgi:hypothetical protein